MDIIFGTYDYNSSNKNSLIYFLKSLRMTNKLCKVVILSSKTNSNITMNNICKQYNTELFLFDNSKNNIIFSRFKYYYDYIISTKIKYNKILMTDVNDVIFFDDPFKVDIGNGFYLATLKCIFKSTQANKKLAAINYNRAHCDYFIKNTKEYFTNTNDIDNFLNKHANNNIINAGTIYAIHEAAINFLEYYINVQNKYNYTMNDQCLFNIYLYDYCTFNILSPPVTSSLILTLGDFKLPDNINNIDTIKDFPFWKNELNQNYLLFHWPGASAFDKPSQKIIEKCLFYIKNYKV
tara:strand:+ start:4021 stop:4899 length:879 start_codon:yes stop_codon:yes gene_type:complete